MSAVRECRLRTRMPLAYASAACALAMLIGCSTIEPQGNACNRVREYPDLYSQCRTEQALDAIELELYLDRWQDNAIYWSEQD